MFAVLAGEVIALQNLKPLALRKGDTLVSDPVCPKGTKLADRRHYPFMSNVQLFHMKRFLLARVKLPDTKNRPRHALGD
jgi:hypothetical protein